MISHLTWTKEKMSIKNKKREVDINHRDFLLECFLVECLNNPYNPKKNNNGMNRRKESTTLISPIFTEGKTFTNS